MIKWSNFELVPEQVEVTGREVKQELMPGSVDRCRFENALRSSTQAGDPPVRKQLPVVREALVYFYLESFVNVPGRRIHLEHRQPRNCPLAFHSYRWFRSTRP